MTLVLQITANGPVAPDYPSLLQELKNSAYSIFGSDIDIDPDTADGQLLAIFAQAIYDANQMGIAVYDSFSPATAEGTGLSSVVKINGILRSQPTFSTVDVVCVGQPIVIENGIVADDKGNQYALPPTVTIPLTGEVTVTATAVELGAINSPIGTVTTIVNPQAGWQTVNNLIASTPGAPVETDAALRRRQANSTMLPSQTILEGLVGAVGNLSGVSACIPYENVTDATDSNGLPPHCISLVVTGGDAQTIAKTILTKKSPGTNTFGTTTEPVTDAYGIPHDVNFYRPTLVDITVGVTLKAMTGFTQIVQGEIAQAISDYLNALVAGQSVLLTRLYTPANLGGAEDSLTYELQSITLSQYGHPLSTADLMMAIYEQPICSTLANVTFTVNT